MTAGVTGDGPYYQKNESAVSPEVAINPGSDYANWGGEFVDDALRFGEQLLRVSDAWPGDIVAGQ
jgi:hypothetical protein